MFCEEGLHNGYIIFRGAISLVSQIFLLHIKGFRKVASKQQVQIYVKSIFHIYLTLENFLEKTLHVRKSCPKNTHFIKEQEDYIREKLPCLTTHLFWDNQKFSFSSQV